jgi:hypothetical protein
LRVETKETGRGKTTKKNKQSKEHALRTENKKATKLKRSIVCTSVPILVTTTKIAHRKQSNAERESTELYDH